MEKLTKNKRVELRVDPITYKWLMGRAKMMRPDGWRAQDEILEVLALQKKQDRTDGLWYGT